MPARAWLAVPARKSPHVIAITEKLSQRPLLSRKARQPDSLPDQRRAVVHSLLQQSVTSILSRLIFSALYPEAVTISNPTIANMSTKRKLPAKFATPNIKATKTSRTPSKQIQAEARAVVGHGALDQDSPSAQLKETATIEISSDEEEEDDLSEDEVNFEADGDVDMEGAEEEDKEAAEPSFGDLVLATSTEPINVKDAFAPDVKSSKKALAMPSGASLGVVLTQALKTNDLALLESCLQTSDLATIRATIQRLDAPLASTLLSLLAARLARRPGRAGSLMVWIQWTLVTHGGYLATQPSLIAKMADLNRIVEERARGLSGLLALKGKLDLLDAQMMLRRSVRDARGREEEESDDEDVIYVEGEEELEGDSEDEMPGVKVNGTSKKRSEERRVGKECPV